MDETKSHITEAYRILMGHSPHHWESLRNLMVMVMHFWDGRKFDVDPRSQKVAKIALCEIGLRWSEDEGLPYEFNHVAERLREMHPAFGADEVTTERMRGLYNVETDYPV